MKALPYFLILLLSLGISILSHNQMGHKEYFMAQYFIITWIGYLTGAGLIDYLLKKKLIKLNVFLIAVCFIPVIGTEPLFENDQYRYLWEGKIFSEGFNPWKIAPASKSLDIISFPERDLIGFNKLTSPYSPLAVIYHSWFSHLTYRYAVSAIQIVNIVLSCFVIFILPPMRPLYLLGIVGLLCKEFAQSIHIDLIAWMFLYFAVNLLETKKQLSSCIMFGLSTLFKVNGFIAFPWFIVKTYRSRDRKWVLLWIAILLICLALNFAGPLNQNESSGLSAFLQYWVWHPGLLSIWEIWSSDTYLGVKVLNLVWIGGITIFGLILLISSRFEKNWLTCVFTFTALARSAFNTWYFPWFGLFGAFAGESLPIIYALMSPFAYIRYAQPDKVLLYFMILITHIWGGIYLFKNFFGKYQTKGKNKTVC